MVSTTRDKEAFLLAPGEDPGEPEVEQLTTQGSILVVEDDAPTLRLERVLLEEEGYEVEVVASGEEAIEAVITKKPALVLLDIGLPGMDGFTACQRIREFSDVPIIMVTGRDCLDDKVKGMNVGADDYVTKPFLTHELATRVKVLLRRSVVEGGEPQRRQNFRQAPVPSTGPGSEPASPQEVASSEITEAPANEAALQQEVTAPESAAAPPNEPDSQQEVTVPEPPVNPAYTTEAGVYEGNVRLTVTALGPVRNLINFVSELRQNPKFRLLRLVANQHKEGMDIWLGLREPLPLLATLTQVNGVNEVTASAEQTSTEAEPLITVLLD